MTEFLYGRNSVLIAGTLFVLILAANEVGYRAGRRWSSTNDEGAKAQTSAIQAAMLGLLALLLGFSMPTGDGTPRSTSTCRRSCSCCCSRCS